MKRFLLFVSTIVFFPLSSFLRLFLSSHTRLHRARFATTSELSHLLSPTPPPNGLLLGTAYLDSFLSITPHKERREIGNLLIVAPTRAGKGLLAVSQLLSWQHSVIVNDIKGELFHATAGYRSTIGEVFVIDPTGRGNCYDPLEGKTTEDELYSSASHLLFEADERERIFTQRATTMLTQLFSASQLERVPALPYTRQLIRSGLSAASERLHSISPQLATQFLDISFEQANFSDRFLLSAWGTLTARLRPLLTETVIRCFTHSDFHASALLTSEKPITIYLRWPEKDLLALSPLVRLLWGTLIDGLISHFDETEGKACQPVLLLIDEAGRTAIPTLADHATTVVGRGVSLWIALQSLSQLETVYGRARAQVIRDNMETQLYYRPTDLTTAKYLEERLGTYSAYSHSETRKDGIAASEGLSERPIPLLTAQEIMQLSDTEVIGFHRRLPPFKLNRLDWRAQTALQRRRNKPAPPLPYLSQIADIPFIEEDINIEELLN